MSDHLAWIADAVGLPPEIVASAAEHGDLTALVLACAVQQLAARPTIASLTEARERAVRGIHAMFGDRAFLSRDVVAYLDRDLTPQTEGLRDLLCILTRVPSGSDINAAALSQALSEASRDSGLQGCRVRPGAERGGCRTWRVEVDAVLR